MGFKDWIMNEGWSIDLSNIPFEELQAQLAGKSSNAIKWLKSRAQFSYSGRKDLPNDFVQVVPLNKSVEPNIVPAIKRALPSFEGMKIYYGFTFVTANNYQDKYSSYTKRANPVNVIEDQIAKIEQDYDKYKISYPPKQQPSARIAQDLDNLANHVIDTLVKTNILTYNKQMRNADEPFLHAYQQVSSQYRNDRNILEYFYFVYFVNLLRRKIQLEKQFSTKEDSTKYLNAIKIAFSKSLKEPLTANGRKTQNQFIKLAAENFHRMMSNRQYQRIVYPYSSKEFNEKFAKYLGNLYGVPALMGFGKLPAGKVSIDYPAIRAHYGDKAQAVIDTINKGTAFGHSGLESANPDKPVEIKNFPQPYRKYIKMWYPLNNYRNKRILVIDDNLDAGGTMERIYDLVKQQQPKAVDIYVPLYIGGGHGVTHS